MDAPLSQGLRGYVATLYGLVCSDSWKKTCDQNSEFFPALLASRISLDSIIYSSQNETL